ncbi:MAG: hypothetical protein ACT4OT_16805 [Acidobacteriota bacterium]
MMRHDEADRPTAEAARDKLAATEIYRDLEKGKWESLQPEDLPERLR